MSVGADVQGAASAVVAPPFPPHLASYRFLAGYIDASALAAADAEARSQRVPLFRLLLDEGRISADAYVAALQAALDPVAPAAGRTATEAIDATSAPPHEIATAVAAVRAAGRIPLLLTREQADWSEPEPSRRRRADEAAHGLRRRSPELSAFTRFATWQILAAAVVIGLAGGGMIVVPDVTLATIAGVVTLPFLVIVGLRVLALAFALRLPFSWQRQPRIADADLPVYSVLVPMFDEADVLLELVDAVSGLDYPPAKLDVLLILESADGRTQAAARALELPPHFRVVVVPDATPRTKPKALNYALQLARGDYIVVYDAEDAPEPDQLRRALAAFQAAGDDLYCVQASLSIDNAGDGWLSRLFALEYTALFDAMLPALVRLGVPVPLGGTSNHFPRRALQALGGWDAWNVTEDADLGLRIARQGGRVATLASTTYEEAPVALGVWIRQRTRWFKGFMQTLLVHNRNPVRLLSELGTVGFLGVHAFLGGIVLSALLHPICIAALLWGVLAGDLLAVPETLLGHALVLLASFNLVAGYLSFMALAALAALRRGQLSLIPYLALVPIYWLLISLAAYRALLQLMVKPYLWEKTPHGTRGARRGPRRAA